MHAYIPAWSPFTASRVNHCTIVPIGAAAFSMTAHVLSGNRIAHCQQTRLAHNGACCLLPLGVLQCKPGVDFSGGGDRVTGRVVPQPSMSGS